MTARRVAASCQSGMPDDLSPAEIAFRELLARPASFAQWAAGVRRAWERENVLWFHGFSNGKPVWKVDRPPPDRSDVEAKDKAPQRFMVRDGKQEVLT
jgi:hypothetical protein